MRTPESAAAYSFLQEHPRFGVKLLLRNSPLTEETIRRLTTDLGYWTWSLVKRNPNLAVSPAYRSFIEEQGYLFQRPSTKTKVIPMFWKWEDIPDEQVDDYLFVSDSTGNMPALDLSAGFGQEFIRKHAPSLSLERVVRSLDLAWSFELIAEWESSWGWEGLSGNPAIPWTLEWVERFTEHLNWKSLSRNTGRFWTRDLLAVSEAKWDWTALFGNEGVGWDVELLSQFYAHWGEDEEEWGGPKTNLSLNTNVKWTDELFHKFEEDLDWFHLSENESLPWTEDFLEKYGDYLNWNDDYENGPGLSGNAALPWTLSFIQENGDHLDLSIVAGNIGVWKKAFAPLLAPDDLAQLWQQYTGPLRGKWTDMDFNPM